MCLQLFKFTRNMTVCVFTMLISDIKRILFSIYLQTLTNLTIVLSVFCDRLGNNNFGADGAKALAPSLAKLTSLTNLW